MKKKKISFFALTVALIFGFTACDNSQNPNNLVQSSQSDEAAEYADLVRALPAPLDSIDETTAEDLQFMREEEKLARDVYITLYEQYNTRVFGYISHSEQAHMKAVLTLLNAYGVDDPVGDNGIGVFTNQDLQTLYNSLVQQGSSSLVEALKVGAAIEEIDILDLFERIDNNANYNDIVLVFGRLEKASENHLRAFVRNLSAQGVTYEPQYLDDATYAEIINGGFVPPMPGDSILTDAQKNAIKFMREEEKLARDVYITFNEQYNLRVFKNISRAEQAHMNAVLRILQAYGIEDPVGNNGIGVFTNQDLQTLYNNLISQGSTSVTDALNVGGAIEEIDILDLLERINLTQNYPMIKNIFSRLERGSEHHLRAFVANLRFRGITYTPQYLDYDFYNQIINP